MGSCGWDNGGGITEDGIVGDGIKGMRSWWWVQGDGIVGMGSWGQRDPEDGIVGIMGVGSKGWDCGGGIMGVE